MHEVLFHQRNWSGDNCLLPSTIAKVMLCFLWTLTSCWHIWSPENWFAHQCLNGRFIVSMGCPLKQPPNDTCKTHWYSLQYSIWHPINLGEVYDLWNLPQTLLAVSHAAPFGKQFDLILSVSSDHGALPAKIHLSVKDERGDIFSYQINVKYVSLT